MLDHPKGAGSEGDSRVDFDPRVRLEFHASKISSDGGLLLFRELDETLGLHDLAAQSLRDDANSDVKDMDEHAVFNRATSMIE